MKINDYQFLETFLDNIPIEHHCLQYRINTVSTCFDQNSTGKLRKYPGHPEGPVSVSVRSLICGTQFIPPQVPEVSRLRFVYQSSYHQFSSPDTGVVEP